MPRIRQPGIGNVKERSKIPFWQIEVSLDNLYPYEYELWARLEPIPYSSDLELHHLIAELEEIWQDRREPDC
jgi:hypothetical protein